MNNEREEQRRTFSFGIDTHRYHNRDRLDDDFYRKEQVRNENHKNGGQRNTLKFGDIDVRSDRRSRSDFSNLSLEFCGD